MVNEYKQELTNEKQWQIKHYSITNNEKEFKLEFWNRIYQFHMLLERIFLICYFVHVYVQVCINHSSCVKVRVQLSGTILSFPLCVGFRDQIQVVSLPKQVLLYTAILPVQKIICKCQWLLILTKLCVGSVKFHFEIISKH